MKEDREVNTSGAVGRDDCAIFAGPSRRGKSYGALHVLSSPERASRDRWVYLDPMCTVEHSGARIVRNTRDLLYAMRTPKFRIVYHYDPTTSDVSYFAIVTLLQQWAKAARVKVTFVLDEYGAMSEDVRGKVPPEAVSLARAGRHYGASVFYVSQRYFDVPPSIRNNLPDAYLFGVSVGYDVRDLNSLDMSGAPDGKRLGDVVRSLARYHYVRYSPETGLYTVNKPFGA